MLYHNLTSDNMMMRKAVSKPKIPAGGMTGVTGALFHKMTRVKKVRLWPLTGRSKKYEI